MPVVAQLVRSTAFIVSISGPAVAPFEQEMYRVGSQLREDGFSEASVNRALEAYTRVAEMAREDVDPERAMASLEGVRKEDWFHYLGFDTREVLAFIMRNLTFDPLPHLRQVRCPFLGIWGESDSFVPVQRSMQLTRDALTAAGNRSFTLELIPGAGHSMHLHESDGPDGASAVFVPGLLDRISSWLDSTLRGPVVP